MKSTGYRTGVVLLGALGLGCATTDAEPERKTPGGFADAGGSGGSGASSGTGGNSGSGGSAATSGSGGSSGADAANVTDAAPDAISDAIADVSVDAGLDADAADAPSEASVPDASSGQVVIVSRSGTGLVIAARSGGSAYTTQTLNANVLDTPALVATQTGAMIAVRETAQGELRYATWNATTGTVGPLTPIGIAGLTLARPALAAGTGVTLSFLGTDFKYYVNRHSGVWQGFAPVLAASVHSFGPGAPSVAAMAGDEAIAFVGDDGKLYTQLAQGGIFQSAHAHTTPALLDKSVAPSIVARTGGGAKFAVVYREDSSGHLLWTEGSANSWSAPALVSTTLTSVGEAALTALSGGTLLLAFRAADDRVRTTLYSGSTWSAPASPFPGSALTAPPALTAGLAGQGEMAWISGGTLLSSILDSSGWKPAMTVVPSAQQTVAIATHMP